MLSFGQDANHAVGLLVLVALLFFILLWLVPFASFWAIGVLFGYHIDLTWGTGFAFWVLKGFALGGLSRVSRSQ